MAKNPPIQQIPPNIDPSRCPGCKWVVPEEYQILPKVLCQNCQRWELRTGILLIPIASATPTPPRKVRMQAAFWQANLPTTSAVPHQTTEKPLGGTAKENRGRPKRSADRKVRQKEIAERWHRFYDSKVWEEKRRNGEGAAKKQFCRSEGIDRETLDTALSQERTEKARKR